MSDKNSDFNDQYNKSLKRTDGYTEFTPDNPYEFAEQGNVSSDISYPEPLSSDVGEDFSRQPNINWQPQRFEQSLFDYLSQPNNPLQSTRQDYLTVSNEPPPPPPPPPLTPIPSEFQFSTPSSSNVCHINTFRSNTPPSPVSPFARYPINTPTSPVSPFKTPPLHVRRLNTPRSNTPPSPVSPFRRWRMNTPSLPVSPLRTPPSTVDQFNTPPLNTPPSPDFNIALSNTSSSSVSPFNEPPAYELAMKSHDDQSLEFDQNPSCSLTPATLEGETIAQDKPSRKIAKVKRCRTAYTEEQLKALNEYFKKSPYLELPERASFAEKLGLSQRRVKVWFQNRRMKYKKSLTTRNTESPLQINEPDNYAVHYMLQDSLYTRTSEDSEMVSDYSSDRSFSS